MTKFKTGQKVYVKNIDTYARVARVNEHGQPIEIDIDGQIVSTVGLIIEAVNLLRQLWKAIQSLFK